MEPVSSPSSLAELLPADRVARAERIAAGASGPGLVFRAAISPTGQRALCESAARISGLAGLQWRPPSPLVFHPDAAPRYYSALRLYTLAAALDHIRGARPKPSDLRWALGTVAMGTTTVPGMPVLSHSSGRARPLQDVVLDVLRAVRAEDGLTALALVVESAKLFETVRLNTHPQPLLPYSLVAVPSARVLSPSVPSNCVDLPFASLPTLGSRTVDGTVLPFPLYALLNAQTRGGYSAGLPLRMFIESVTAVMQRDWELATLCPVGISVSLREFLNWFYGSYKHWPSRDRYWRRFMEAAEALDRSDVRFPFDFEGKSGLLRVVSLSVIPRGPDCLDDQVTLLVQLPPGSVGGPPIDRVQLRAWGLRSEVAYRMLIGLAYYWHRPGHTLQRDTSGAWVRSDDPAQYEPFSDEGLISLCYPTSTMRKRAVLLRRSHEWLRILDAAGALRYLPDRRILPPLPTRRSSPPPLSLR